MDVKALKLTVFVNMGTIKKKIEVLSEILFENMVNRTKFVLSVSKL